MVRSVPSRSSRFFSRRKAFSIGSPFLSLISVNDSHFPSMTSNAWLNAPSPVRVGQCMNEARPVNEPSRIVAES